MSIVPAYAAGSGNVTRLMSGFIAECGRIGGQLGLVPDLRTFLKGPFRSAPDTESEQ